MTGGFYETSHVFGLDPTSQHDYEFWCKDQPNAQLDDDVTFMILDTTNMRALAKKIPRSVAKEMDNTSGGSNERINAVRDELMEYLATGGGTPWNE